ncbi:PadR family transcriptional regulator [Janibacter sp. YIM B02568]|uniref:PadR family transcriptional regulator n=1 Tax=Janibacter endophyticus TaxID=2806261 RepID=UPI00194E1F11|nr:PadR family transcriptional regulator [Janibacter endophyticus]MBM6544766.1 PadR family transcriptional regulator [Janibacter endophyticus]
MSVRLGLLALLDEQPMYGAQLRAEFESRTGGTWPLNIGQVYTTLSRLERDGLVVQRGGPDDDGRITYALTPAGHDEVVAWWATPVVRDTTPRDELVIKLALAVTAPGVDVEQVVQTQRTASLRALRDLTRLKQQAHAAERERIADDETARLGRTELAWVLVLENLIFAAEGEVRWLDHVEARLAREATLPQPAASTPSPTADETQTETTEVAR